MAYVTTDTTELARIIRIIRATENSATIGITGTRKVSGKYSGKQFDNAIPWGSV